MCEKVLPKNQSHGALRRAQGFFIACWMIKPPISSRYSVSDELIMAFYTGAWPGGSSAQSHSSSGVRASLGTILASTIKFPFLFPPITRGSRDDKFLDQEPWKPCNGRKKVLETTELPSTILKILKQSLLAQ
ncbi:hypothetical protein VNO77_02400 [Canavalia gladiata]|uniref:Uncharacterized protein n=1 Tax=Canavalia gladiata TaxID=3824 RepID=A0AAN9RB96_CANGL